MNEGSDTTVYDKSKYGNNGTIYGATWTEDAEKGECLSFDGNNDRAVISGFKQSQTPDSFSVSFWIKNVNTGKHRFIIKPLASGSTYWFVSFSSADYLQFGLFDGAASVSQNADFSGYAGVWTHVVCVFDSGSKMEIYINNVIQSTISTALLGVGSSSRYLSLADIGWMGVNDGYLKAILNDVRIYNRALSESEISALYRLGVNKSLSDGLVLDAPLNEGSGSTVFDKSKYGNNGTITGATWVVDAEKGKCLSFDGIDDILTISHNEVLSDFSEFSLAFWTKIPSTSPSKCYICSKLTGGWGWDTGYGIHFDEGRIRFVIGVEPSGTGDTIYDTLTSTGINDDEWHLIVCTWKNGEERKIFIDGFLNNAASTSGIYSPSNSSLTLGNAFSDPFLGSLKDFRIFSRALSDAEIGQLYRLTQKGVE